MPDVDIGHFTGHRNQIIGQIGVGQLAALIVDAMLEQGRAEALHHATADLLVDQLRIDDPAAIFDHPMLQQLDKTAVGIDLEPAGLDPVGKGEGIFAGNEMAGRHQLGLNARRQRVRPEIDDPRQLLQIDPRRAVIGVHDRIVDDVEFRGRGLQDRCRDIQDIAAKNLGGLQRRLAADSGAARGPGAAAIGRVVGVAQNDPDARHRNPEHAADDLGGQGFRALPLLADAGLADHRPGCIEPHGNAVLRRDPGTADAVKRRARVGDLDEARNTDATVNVASAQCRLLGAQSVIVHHADQLVDGGVMRQ